ncbi:MAG TPA: sigma 54-interacting transcriptional regulator [Candidatus Acidoferrales bacterium]|nr:sigma 54-interacting transcriptional regulator [Candidatus Acidoferrales bacterium]
MGQEETQRQSNLKPAEQERWKLLQSAPDAIVIVNRTGQISFVNSHAERMFGYAPHELLGEPVEVLVPEAARPAHLDHRSEFSRAPRTREMGSGLQLQGRRKDGSTFPVEISLSPLEEPEGQFVVSAIRDVTERRQIQEALRLSEERFRRLVAEVKDYAIFMLDPEGNVKTWNEGAERIKGYRADEIIGQHFSRFYSSEDAERGKPEEQLKIAAREGRSEDDGWRIRKDGSRFWASVVITALHDQDGKLLGFSKVTRDITERKRIREAFIFEVTNALLSNLDISKLLGAIGLCIRQVKAFDYATLALYDSETKKLRIHSLGAAPPGLPELPGGDLISIAGSPHGWSYVSKKPLLLKGLPGEEFPHELPQHLVRIGVKSGCWMPLIGREGPLGTLNLFSRQPNAFQEKDLDALGQLASQVAVALDNALAFQRMADLNARLQNEKLYLEDELRTSSKFEEIIGNSTVLKRVLKQIETVAPTGSTVLILGETGTGKDRLARAVHDLSPRRERAFVKVNCASVPAGLLESELFGHEKGAFTGAIAQRIGRFELAHQGTLFLDEVGEIPLELQPKLLRVLQEKQFERVGSSRTLTSDVRIVAATNRDLAKLVASGQFRSDLYYRLSVFPVLVPPLRERSEDIPLLVHYFLSQFAKRLGKNVDVVSLETMEALRRYSWPGNVRELEHVIERAVILSPGPELRIAPVELAQADKAAPTTVSATLEDIEREHILRVLRETKGKIGGSGGAAERLGMNRTTLNSRMHKLQITRKDL